MMPDILPSVETVIHAAFFLAGLFVGTSGVLTAWALARMAGDHNGVRERDSETETGSFLDEQLAGKRDAA